MAAECMKTRIRSRDFGLFMSFGPSFGLTDARALTIEPQLSNQGQMEKAVSGSGNPLPGSKKNR